MKTLALNFRKMSGALSMLLVGTFFILLAGCQKEELAQPNSSNDDASAAMSKLGKQSLDENALPATWVLLNIDHSSGNTIQPSYRVVLESDGNGTFIGRNNTAIIGGKKFYVDKEQLVEIKNTLTAARMNEMEILPFMAGLPIISTSFRANNHSEMITRFDYNDKNISASLISLREKLENMLGISKYVITTKSRTDLELNVQHN